MSLGEPKLLWLAVVVPLLVIAYALDGQRRRRVLERIGHLPTIAQMIETLSPGRRRLQGVCAVLATGALAVALARPQVAGRARLTESRGLDLVVALDLSRSMLARDIYPSRLERAKGEVARLLDGLKGDRVGLVAFAGETLAYPLTTDYEAAKLFWRDLSPADMPVGGSDLGRAITAAQELLDRSAARTPEGKRRPAQVVLLITDGEDTEGRGLAAAKQAAQHGIHIYSVAIGSKDRPFVPLSDEEGKPSGYLSGDDGEPVRVGFDEDGLRKIASVSGGEYFTIEPRRFGVERVQQAIAGLERTEEEARLEREPEDIGRWFLLGAFALLVFGSAIGDRRRHVANTAIIPQERPAPRPARREPTGSGREPTASRRFPIAPTVLLLFGFPLLSGFDLFERRDPDIEAGNRALEAGKPEDALKAYDRAVAARPDDSTAHFNRGTALLALNRLPEAVRELQHGIESREPAVKADAYYNLGLAQHRQERFREAVDAYKRALALRPDDRRTKWNLEVAQRRLKEQKQEQQKQDQQKQDQQKQDQQDQQKQEQAQQNQKPEQQKPEQQKAEQQKAEQQKPDQKSEQQKAEQPDQQKQDPQTAEQQKAQTAKPDEQKGDQKAMAVRPGDLDKQDAEAVLDALERVEPTVQKDLARRRAGARKAKKDW